MSNEKQGGTPDEPLWVCPVCDALLRATGSETGSLGACPGCKSLLEVCASTGLAQRREVARAWLADTVAVRTLAGHVLEGLTVGQVLRLMSDGRLRPDDMVRAGQTDQFHPLHSDARFARVDWRTGPTAHLACIGLMLAGDRAGLLRDARAGLSFISPVPRRAQAQFETVRREDVLAGYEDRARSLMAEHDAYRWPADVSDPRAALLEADPTALRIERETASRLVAGQPVDPLQMDWGTWAPGAPVEPSAVRFDEPEPIKEDQEVISEPELVDEPISRAALADMLHDDDAKWRLKELADEEEAEQEQPETAAAKVDDGIISFDDLVDDFDHEDKPASVPEARLIDSKKVGDSVAELGEEDLVVEEDEDDDDLPPTVPRPPRKPGQKGKKK